MARPKRNGLDYFPLDTDFMTDERIALLESEFPSEGVFLYLNLLAQTYRVGMCLRFGELELDALCCKLRRKRDKLQQIVTKMLELGLFSKLVYQESGYLTSKAIQRRYIEACKRRREIKIPEGVLLLPQDEIGETVIINIRKESKVKGETDCDILQQIVAETDKHPKGKPKEPPGYREGCTKIGNHVYLNRTEYQKLCDEFTRDHVRAKITTLEGGITDGRKLYTGYKNHYLTILKWLRNDVSMGKIRIDKGNTVGQRPIGGNHA